MNKSIIIIVALLLGACSSNTDIKVDVYNKYPSLPLIDKPSVSLLPVQADIPRDTTKKVQKTTPECVGINTPECKENPPLPNSNIFVGFDQANWNNWQINYQRLSTAIQQRDIRIDEVNRQREEWVRLNTEEEARKKADAAKK